jgi:DNA-binding NarL/FixJ family response regulator
MSPGERPSLRVVWEHTEREDVEEPGLFPVAPDLVEALVELCALEEALAVTSRLRTLSTQQEHPWGLASTDRCAGLVELANRWDDSAVGALERAAAGYDSLGLRFDAARSLLALGRAQRRHRKWGAARRTLERAEAAFDELGSPGWVEEVRAENVRVGARRPPPSGELTPAERRVAELAADGLANKEIAQALFVSVKTVEGHLSHVYVKLGVRSRAQLARRLSPG